MLVSGCGLLCTHLWDPVPRFRRHPFSDYGFASVCVCVCVCVCVYPGHPRPALATPMAWHYSWHLIFFSLAVRCFFLHFPSDAISSSTYIRPRFSGPRRCVCSIVSWGLITAGTPTARCTRGGCIDSLITLRHRCWNTHGSNPIVSLDGMSQTGFLSAK